MKKTFLSLLPFPHRKKKIEFDIEKLFFVRKDRKTNVPIPKKKRKNQLKWLI